MDNSRDLLLIELMIKISSLTKILVSKNLISENEIQNEMKSISKELVEQIKNLTPETLNNLISNVS